MGIVGDGLPDLAVADTIVGGGFDQPGFVWVILNEGAMSFAEPVAYAVGADAYPLVVALGDLDGNGSLDIAALTSQVYPGQGVPSARRVVVMFNDGAGGFSWGGEYEIAADPDAHPWPGLAIGDIDGDGACDILALSGSKGGPGRLTALRNDGLGAFAITETYAIATQPRSVALADIDGDGHPDAVVMHNRNWNFKNVLGEPYLTVLKNDGKGEFSITLEYASVQRLTDGDVILMDSGPGLGIGFAMALTNDNILTHLHSGGMSLDAAASYGVRGAGMASAIAAADFDRDGRLDLAAAALSWDMVSISYGAYRPACPADCDGDGGLDLFDFLCFVSAFNAGQPGADCDGNGVLNLFDFLCVAAAFNAGC